MRPRQFAGAVRDYLDEVLRDTPPAQPPDIASTWKAFVAEEQAKLQTAGP